MSPRSAWQRSQLDISILWTFTAAWCPTVFFGKLHVSMVVERLMWTNLWHVSVAGCLTKCNYVPLIQCLALGSAAPNVLTHVPHIQNAPELSWPKSLPLLKSQLRAQRILCQFWQYIYRNCIPSPTNSFWNCSLIMTRSNQFRSDRISCHQVSKTKHIRLCVAVCV